MRRVQSGGGCGVLLPDLHQHFLESWEVRLDPLDDSSPFRNIFGNLIHLRDAPGFYKILPPVRGAGRNSWIPPGFSDEK